MTVRRFDRVHVVIPARDEELHLDACLDSVLAAADVVRRDRGTAVRVTVVLDSCVDGSADVVRRRPGVDGVVVRVGIVGAARAVGIDRAARWAPRGSRTWIACADADTVVPPEWLSTQLEVADEGCDLVVGTVAPEPGDLHPALLRAWHEGHALGEGHPHVHGANLGFALDAYLLVGGFAPLATGEDVDLVARMRAAGIPWRSTDRTRAVTSGRPVGRAPAGFAEYLRLLALDSG